jgi:hypothetical protein
MPALPGAAKIFVTLGLCAISDQRVFLPPRRQLKLSLFNTPDEEAERAEIQKKATIRGNSFLLTSDRCL